MQVIQGDCLEVMRGMEENSVHAIVCDPPYELTSIVKRFGKKGSVPAKHGSDGRYARLSKGFMGKTWDGTGIAMRPKVWEECLRVAKPGAYLLAFGGTRTFHRLACAIEDAGWTLKDTLMWCYGSGFPKSHAIGKAIDGRRDDYKDILRVVEYIRRAAKQAGLDANDINNKLGWGSAVAHHFLAPSKSNASCPRLEQWIELKKLLDCDNEMDAEIWRLNGRKGKPGDDWEKREVVGLQKNAMSGWNMDGSTKFVDRDITLAATPEAKQWKGFGTALKPAWEPIILAQAPLEGTYAQNVLKWGCGALNIDACRIGKERVNVAETGREIVDAFTGEPIVKFKNKTGRWPANFLLSHSIFCEKIGEREVAGYAINRFKDGAKPFGGGAGHPYESEKQGGQVVDVYRCVPDCPVAILDGQSGVTKSTGGKNTPNPNGSMFGVGGGIGSNAGGLDDTGGSSRFFYCAKASRRERNAGLEELDALWERREGMEEKVGGGLNATVAGDSRTGRKTIQANNHPTVKPIALLRYLCRLVTPPNGIILDPFAGSGSTGCAAALEGFDCTLVEKELEYVEIARARLKHWEK